MKQILTAIISFMISLAACATETHIELSGTAASNECIVMLRDYDKDSNKQRTATGATRLDFSCADLVKSGLAVLNEVQEFKFSRKALRMKQVEFFDALNRIKPSVELIAVHGCVPFDKNAEGDQSITLAQDQALCLDTREYQRVQIGDISNWRIVGRMLVPSTTAGVNNTLYLESKDHLKPLVVHIKRAI